MLKRLDRARAERRRLLWLTRNGPMACGGVRLLAILLGAAVRSGENKSAMNSRRGLSLAFRLILMQAVALVVVTTSIGTLWYRMLAQDRRSGIVERWGGRIWCASELGRGATFAFALPPARAMEGEPV